MWVVSVFNKRVWGVMNKNLYRDRDRESKHISNGVARICKCITWVGIEVKGFSVKWTWNIWWMIQSNFYLKLMVFGVSNSSLIMLQTDKETIKSRGNTEA